MKPRTSREDLLKTLEDLGTNQAAYPPELLAARRAAFLDQIAQRTQVDEPVEEFTPGDRQVVQLLRRLKTVELEHPYRLLAIRRLIFRRQVAQVNRPSFWQTLRATLQEKLRFRRPTWSPSSMNLVLTSLMALSFVTFVTFLVFGSLGPSVGFSASHSEVVQPAPILATLTQQVNIICKPGYVPPLCLAAQFDRRSDLTFQGNGLARPAVAKDTISGYAQIHNAAYVNDGLYGPGASWVSASPNSWIKIDLGKPTTINTVTFGRDRLGQLEGHDPGQFVIAVALTDNVYANGNSSNDDKEYKSVFNSQQAGFDGTVSGADTVVAQFNPVAVRYLKITFQNEGTAVDEVEAFLQPVKAGHPTKVAKEHRSNNSAISPTRTPTPTLTNTPTTAPTDTPMPTNTPTPTLTDTPTPTSTDTPTLTPTDTPTSTPTDTPVPTDTPTPLPTNTPVPTNTPLPTDTPTPLPTSTPVPTDTFIAEKPFIALTHVPTQANVP